MKLFRSLLFLCALSVSVVNCFSLDREAFTFTHYDLNVRIEPEQQRLAVRGVIGLRNNSPTPQKIAVLQISSSLGWRSIQCGDKPLQFVAQPYTSDIDHTGALSEALVTLPEAVPPKGTIELQIGYEGVIALDATRLTKIGAPEATARSSDWDQISPKFTAVRGIGYVAWYPIATEAVDLADGEGLPQTIARWKSRHAESTMNLLFESTVQQTILSNGWPNGAVLQTTEPMAKIGAFGFKRLDDDVPAFVLGDFKQIEVGALSTVDYLAGSEEIAKSYANTLAGLTSIAGAAGSRRLHVVQLSNPDAAEFVAGSILLIPFNHLATEENRLTLIYALTKQQVRSPRAWITEGLAHYAQVADIERRRGRRAALEYLNAHSSVLEQPERKAAPNDPSTTGNGTSLVNSPDDIYLQTKAMWVCWMLRDLLPAENINLLMLHYAPSEDKESSYFQRLIEKQSHRDLEWFFDDWVYRDRGLPDFKVPTAFTRKTLPDGYIIAITVDNLGAAGAEVPVTVKFEGGEITKRLLVLGKNNAVIRIAVPKVPQEVVVNDGSVPESDTTNNVFKIETSDALK
jgi:hypothetical protein